MAGTVTVTRAQKGPRFHQITLTWVSTAGGAVSGNPFNVGVGPLWEVIFVPDGGGTQPTDLYDITLADGANAVDYANGKGANLSNVNPSVGLSSGGGPLSILRGGTLDLVVANAGAAKGGTVILVLGRDL